MFGLQTAQHLQWFVLKVQQRNRNERTDKEKLAPAYFKIITGKTLGATQVWKSSWLEGPTVTGADSVFCKQN